MINDFDQGTRSPTDDEVALFLELQEIAASLNGWRVKLYDL